MHQTALRRLAALAALLALTVAPAAVRASDWKDRLTFLMAPGYQLFPGDYAAGVPDTMVFLQDQTQNLYTDLQSRNDDGTINAVIEIPQGDVKKFETDTTTGRLFWELKSGKPRKVSYLGYPGNYGMVPRTLGGDGDPLDVIVIGEMKLRGDVAPAKLVGVMTMVDGGEPDDKLIAVVPGSPFDGKTLAQLDGMGVTAILKSWFENYKGPGAITVTGFGDLAAAQGILSAAEANYSAPR